MPDTGKTILESANFLPEGSDESLRYPEWPISDDGSTWFVAHRSSGQGVFWLALSRGSDSIWRAGYNDHTTGCEWKPISEQRPSDFWSAKNPGLRDEACILAEMEILSMVQRKTIGNTISRTDHRSDQTVLVSRCVPGIIKHSLMNRTVTLSCSPRAWRILSDKLTLSTDTSLIRLGAVSSHHPQLVVVMVDHDGSRQVNDWEILNLDTGALTTIYHTGNSDHPLSLYFNLMSVARSNAYTGGASIIPQDLHGHVESLVRACADTRDSIEAGMEHESSLDYRPDMSVLHLLLSSPR